MNRTIASLFLLFTLPFFSYAQHPLHKFKTGDKLPDLVLITAFGDTLQTSGLKGKKTLITFNRYVSCPLCNFRTHELLEHYDTLKTNGLVIISVYESGKETLTEYTTKEQVPFSMIPDPQQLLYKKFKVQKSWWKTFIGLFNHYGQKHSSGKKLFKSQYKRDGHLNRIGADFLIDENGIIHTAYYGKFVGDHLPVDEIVKWVLQN
ncbi:MAG: redoxin domain-containing protein [Bacteroidetes bacterium]|nr:redoxin domain-containing protein [Bacteroidota bacterium]